MLAIYIHQTRMRKAYLEGVRDYYEARYDLAAFEGNLEELDLCDRSLDALEDALGMVECDLITLEELEADALEMRERAHVN